MSEEGVGGPAADWERDRAAGEPPGDVALDRVRARARAGGRDPGDGEAHGPRLSSLARRAFPRRRGALKERKDLLLQLGRVDSNHPLPRSQPGRLPLALST